MYVDDLLIVKFAKEDAKKEGIAEGLTEGLTKGIAKGMAKGIAEGKKEIVIGMLDNGLDRETIAKYTKLTVDEIEKIEESLVNC